MRSIRVLVAVMYRYCIRAHVSRRRTCSNARLAFVPNKRNKKLFQKLGTRNRIHTTKHRPKRVRERNQSSMDRDTVLQIIEKDGYNLRYVHDEFTDDRPIVLHAVRHCGSALQFASDTIKGDKKVVLAAVSQCGWAIKFASDELKADREVVLHAVRRHGIALRNASEELREDHEIARCAVEQNRFALTFVSVTLLNEPLFVTEIIHLGVRVYRTCWANLSVPQRDFMQKLTSVLASMADIGRLSVDEHARQQMRAILHELWLVDKLFSDQNLSKAVIPFVRADPAVDYRKAKDQLYCAPVITAAAKQGRNWRIIDEY